MDGGISIFGLGYVGSVSAACLANKNIKVIGVDTNQMKIDMLNSGQALIIEPGLSQLTEQAVKNGNLRATIDARDAVLSSDLTFLCVGTPSQPNNSLDLTYVKHACENIGSALKDKKSHHTIACRSTMFPGSMKNVVIPTIEKASGKKAGKDFSICINPEFMKEGTAIYDFAHPPKNVVGSQHQLAFDLLSQINSLCTNMPTICIDIESAELIKYCDNVWHALKVGFANEVGNVCKALGVDSHAIMDVFCKDTTLNISPYYLKPGFAFGGSCLPKDLRAFLYESKKLNVELPILNSVMPSNKLHIENAIKMVIRQENKQVGILGFSFKDNTDDLRESPIIELIERLIGKGYELTLYDKNVNAAKLHGANREYLLNHIPHISQLMVPTIDDVLRRSKTIVIGNQNNEFESIFDKISKDHIIIDLVRIKKSLPSSKQYQGICW